MNMMTYEPKEFMDRFIINSPFFDHDNENFNFPYKADSEELKVNISETPENYILVAETPGLKDKDIDLVVKDGVLTLKTRQEKNEESSGETYRVREFSERNFERSFKLGNTVDQNNVTAKLKDGLLRVTLPKREEAKAKSVKIKIEH